jgi:hypothetical protein
MKTNLKNIAGMAVLIGLVLFMTNVGIGDVIDIAAGDTLVTDLSNDTWAVYGSDGVDTIERIATIFIGIAALTTLGIVNRSRGNPKALNDFIRYTPIAGAAVCLANYSTDFFAILSNDFVWSAHNEGYIGMLLVLSGWTVWAFTNMMSSRNAY